MNRNVEDNSITDFVDKVKSAQNEYIRQRQELMSCEPERLGIYLDVKGHLLAHAAPFEWMWLTVKKTDHADLCRVDTSHTTWNMLVSEATSCTQIFPLTFIKPFDGVRQGKFDEEIEKKSKAVK